MSDMPFQTEDDTPKYIIGNNFLNRPIWTGIKFSLVFFLIPLFWKGPTIFINKEFWVFYSFIIFFLYLKEIIAIVLNILGYSHLVDNSWAEVQWTASNPLIILTYYL